MDDTNTMEYRIGLEKQNKRDDQVTELILDNCRALQISGLTEAFVNLETLSLINVGLTTLKGFPKLPKLKKLELSDNRLAGGLNLLHGSPNLQHLNLSGNRFKDFEALEPLKEFRNLVNLDLYKCEVTKVDDYRKKVFELMPNLQALDGYDRNQREVNSDDENDDDEDEDEDEEESDVENHIVRNGSNGDKIADGSDEEADDEEDSNEEDYDDDDDDLDDEEYDDDDGDIEGVDDEEEDIGQDSSGNMADITNDDDNDDDVQEIVDDDDDDVDDEEEEDDDGADLKELQKDSIVDESDDEDFEPSDEPDERDHEIDPEDDVDEDADVSGDLSASKLDTTVNSTADIENLKRGTKRKLEEDTDEVRENETTGGDD